MWLLVAALLSAQAGQLNNAEQDCERKLTIVLHYSIRLLSLDELIFEDLTMKDYVSKTDSSLVRCR